VQSSGVAADHATERPRVKRSDDALPQKLAHSVATAYTKLLVALSCGLVQAVEREKDERRFEKRRPRHESFPKSPVEISPPTAPRRIRWTLTVPPREGISQMDPSNFASTVLAGNSRSYLVSKKRGRAMSTQSQSLFFTMLPAEIRCAVYDKVYENCYFHFWCTYFKKLTVQECNSDPLQSTKQCASFHSYRSIALGYDDFCQAQTECILQENLLALTKTCHRM
jgi:hypothetical protein